MALTENEVVDRIEILETGHVQIRTATVIKRDEVEVSRSFHRHVISPGDNYSNETVMVKAHCKTAHTPEVIAKYYAKQEAEYEKITR